ncbi:hypothetical protein HYC85_003424 [Camellia sinensis]|uniref:Uncharacterized protein n=1 Tax=Camellia sinensis TaxID=4442 RepID=A0A7J7IBI6_CAMSI|nr:hypothetical protein HYC85_003424 [Camellia sinensis]
MRHYCSVSIGWLIDGTEYMRISGGPWSTIGALRVHRQDLAALEDYEEVGALSAEGEDEGDETTWTVKKLSEFGNENMVELKFCFLVECNELQTIIDGGEFYTGGESGVDKKLVRTTPRRHSEEQINFMKATFSSLNESAIWKHAFKRKRDL